MRAPWSDAGMTNSASVAMAALCSALRPTTARSAAGLIFVRLAFGYHLLQYSHAALWTAGGRAEFVGYLHSLHVPAPDLMGILAMGTEFFGGLCLVLGVIVRPACVALLINFLVALGLVHLHQPYLKSFEAIQMVCVALTLLLTGGGPISVDAWRRRGEIDELRSLVTHPRR
jgi:putative oxidoreductase